MEFNTLSLIRMGGGLALFLYGMTLMGGGLERAAGPSLEHTLRRIAGSTLRALLTGIGVTAVIQSSSAATVMVVGFVNAGILTLRQSVGMILGANIGTTITAQLLRLDNGGRIEDSLLLQLIKPKNLAWITVLIGVIFLLRGKGRRSHPMAEILLGFGILFIGMSTMETAMQPLAELPWIHNLFAAAANPAAGVLVGAAVTAVLQSSSASVGILQALSATGTVTWSAAIPIILGQNIGTCVTALLSASGSSRNARRAAMVHFYFNAIGSAVFLAAIYLFQHTVGFPFFQQAVDKAGIANFHTLFNTGTALLFLPFTGGLVRLAEHSIPEAEEAADPLSRLEPRFLSTPALALEQARLCVANMGLAAQENVRASLTAVLGSAPLPEEAFARNESFLDRAEVEIGKYLVAVQGTLSEELRRMHDGLLHALSDFEKIGDYAQNIFERAGEIRSGVLPFSSTASVELRTMGEAVTEQLRLTVEGYQARQADSARAVEPLEEVVDDLKDLLKTRHIARLSNGECRIPSGIIFLDVVHDLEKIGDHCENLAMYTIQLCEGDGPFDPHGFSNREHRSSAAFLNAVQQCRERYRLPSNLPKH